MALKRRDLLLGSEAMTAGLAAGSLASGPTSAQAQQSPTKWDRDADVVVIGSGATGLPAAIVAQGLKAVSVSAHDLPMAGARPVAKGHTGPGIEGAGLRRARQIIHHGQRAHGINLASHDVMPAHQRVPVNAGACGFLFYFRIRPGGNLRLALAQHGRESKT